MSYMSLAPITVAPSSEEIAEFQRHERIRAWLQANGHCTETAVVPGVRQAIDAFNDLVDPAVKPMQYVNGCGGCVNSGESNKAADLYAKLDAFLVSGQRYYEQNSSAPAEPSTVEDRVTAIEAQLATITAQLATLINTQSPDPDPNIST